jgi:hypothetical protein
VSAALLDPPSFYPEKLSVRYIDGVGSAGLGPALPRRYTLTHNDLTGALQLTIGREYNRQQISGMYTRLLRDEIKAEWVQQGGDGLTLHVHCHVSGEERWLAPPILRNFIFRREMTLVSRRPGARLGVAGAEAVQRCGRSSFAATTCCTPRPGAGRPRCRLPCPPGPRVAPLQVLDTFLHADRELLQRQPQLPAAQVLVHFHSDIQVGAG